LLEFASLTLAILILLGEYRAMDLDHTLIALADPTRRAILQRLSEGEARVTDLAAPFDISLNSVSKHIRLLERADLVSRRIMGREHVLRFNRAPLEDVAEWIQHHRTFWIARLEKHESDDAVRRPRKEKKP
jgi:DNA-binding transcriptional ArsR family regulator